MSTPQTNDGSSQIHSAIAAFDHLFANDIEDARKAFSDKDSPYHLLGLGVCAFLEAALGMETGLMAEATRCLTLSEAGAKRQLKTYKSASSALQFAPSLQWEVLQADAILLLGLTQALSESYMGYVQCLYSLNSAHSKFTKLYKAVFPSGLEKYSTPATTPAPSRKPSNPSINSAYSTTNSNTSSTHSTTTSVARSGFFSRWTGGSSLSIPKASNGELKFVPNGPVDELIVAGTGFGFGLFNLALSLMPGKVKSIVGFFGFAHDRKLALQALAVSAARTDVHSVFAGLVLMTYHGLVLLMSGYQADEKHIMKQYRSIVDTVSSRYPTGSLWILNKAKILRMSHDVEGAIEVLQDGLKPERPHSFRQADTLLVFELAWNLLSLRRYEEAANMFMRMVELNSWSHATYYYIAAGCHFTIGNVSQSQALFDKIPSLFATKKIGGKDLPVEVYIRKKLAFFKAKQASRGGAETDYVQAIKLSPADEVALFWNTHGRIDKNIAEIHIKEWSALTPAVSDQAPYTSSGAVSAAAGQVSLDTPDELAVRALLLGIVHRTVGNFEASRVFLQDAHRMQPKIETSTWVGSYSMFELAVLDLKKVEAGEKTDAPVEPRVWLAALKSADAKLDAAAALATSSVDLSSRLDSRIAMLRNEISTKRDMLLVVP